MINMINISEQGNARLSSCHLSEPWSFVEIVVRKYGKYVHPVLMVLRNY